MNSKLWQPVNKELYTKLVTEGAELTAIAVQVVKDKLGFTDESAIHAAAFTLRKEALDIMAGGWQFYEVSPDPVENLKNFRLFQGIVQGDPVRNFIVLVADWKDMEVSEVGRIMENASQDTKGQDTHVSRENFHRVADYWLLADWLFGEGEGGFPGFN